jgi:hypothetical protein
VKNELDEIITTLQRVERKIDASALVFQQHALDDDARFAALTGQRGIVRITLAGFVAAGAYLLHKLIGHGTHH